MKTTKLWIPYSDVTHGMNEHSRPLVPSFLIAICIVIAHSNTAIIYYSLRIAVKIPRLDFSSSLRGS